MESEWSNQNLRSLCCFSSRNKGFRLLTLFVPITLPSLVASQCNHLNNIRIEINTRLLIASRVSELLYLKLAFQRYQIVPYPIQVRLIEYRGAPVFFFLHLVLLPFLFYGIILFDVWWCYDSDAFPMASWLVTSYTFTRGRMLFCKLFIS